MCSCFRPRGYFSLKSRRSVDASRPDLIPRSRVLPAAMTCCLLMLMLVYFSVEVSLEDAVELFIAADLYTLDRLKVLRLFCCYCCFWYGRANFPLRGTYRTPTDDDAR